MTTLLVLAVVTVAAGVYLSWTAGRIDRLHTRVEAARNALDAQLVRRAAAARALADHVLAAPAVEIPATRAAGLVAEAEVLHVVATAALAAPPLGREAAENDLSRALRRFLAALPEQARVPGQAGDPELGRLLEELDVAATRVGLARTFHNEAVRDTRSLRGRRVPRLFRLAGHAGMPQFFEIDDTLETAARGPGS